MSEKFPARGYRDNVLADCFEDAKKFFLEHYLDVDRAHALMLAEQGVVSSADLGRILTAIEKLDLGAIRKFEYDGTVEDLFFFLQREIAAACGDKDIAGKLHTARSRNDIDVTIYRLYLRQQTLSLIEACHSLHQVLLELSGAHHESLMPAYTHTQPAQPTTIAHYLLAMAENVSRDIRRLQFAYGNMNHCPLGACAITTTGFPIDRFRVAELLGFDGPTGNSYGSIASVDYFTELLGCVACLLVNAGKFAQEFLLMAMAEFDVIRLPDGYVQASSIMPQKRNPVAVEHVRAIASKALGQSLGVFTAVHNTPFGDINDVEDDLQPLVYSAVRDANRAVSLLGDTLKAAEFNLALLAERAEANFITVTELADVIVRREELPFSKAHEIVAACVRQATATGGVISHDLLREAADDVAGRELSISADELEQALSADNFVAVRTIHGGPATDETRRACTAERQLAAECERWLRDRRDQLDGAAKSLNVAVHEAMSR